MHQHDDQHAACCVVEHPVEDDDCGENEHDVGVGHLSSDHQRQVPTCNQDAQDQAGNEGGLSYLKPGNREASPTRFLPCSADPWNEEHEREGHEELRPSIELGGRGTFSTEENVEGRSCKCKKRQVAATRRRTSQV